MLRHFGGWARRVRNARARYRPEVLEGPIVGWRGWDLTYDSDGPVLISPSFRTLWTGPLAEADRPPELHKEPSNPGHGHGVYAIREYDLRHPRQPVVGQVELYGTVAEHEKGWRGERALIRKLYLLPKRLRDHDTHGTLTLTLGLTWVGGPKTCWPRERFQPQVVEALKERYQCDVDVDTGRRLLERLYQWKELMDGHREAEEADQGEAPPNPPSGTLTLEIVGTSGGDDGDAHS